MIRKGLFFSAPFLLALGFISVYGWMNIEPGARIATHWDIEGNVNGYTGKETLLFLQPAMALGLILLLSVLPFVDPRQENLRKSAAFYLTAWIGSLAILTAVHAMIVWSAVSGAPPDIAIVNVVTAIFIMTTGNFMAKSRSNWFAGIRTPWTLSSEHAWKVANRTGGWLFVLAGLGSLAATLMNDDKLAIGVLLAGVLTAVVASITVSYFAWRSDPERVR